MLRAVIKRLNLAFKVAEIDTQGKAVDGLRRLVGKFLVAAPAGRPGADTGGVWVGSNLPEATDREIRELQLTVRMLLDRAVNHQTVNDAEAPALAFGVAVVENAGAFVTSIVSGSVTDRFVLALALLLSRVGSKRVLRCQGCGGAFLKRGRRTHCARIECRKRRRADYWQGYKQTKAGKAALKRHRLRLYETVYKEHGWTPRAKTKKKRPTSSTTRRRAQ